MPIMPPACQDAGCGLAGLPPVSRLLSAPPRIRRFRDGLVTECDDQPAATAASNPQPSTVFSAIIEIISNMTAAPTIAVMLFGLSLVGIMQTTSPPMMFSPLAA